MESISFPDCLCQRAESEAIIYIYTEGLCKLESRTSSSRQYLFAPRTLGCFVPLGWASLFTLTLGMRRGSIQHRYLAPERPEEGGSFAHLHCPPHLPHIPTRTGRTGPLSPMS